MNARASAAIGSVTLAAVVAVAPLSIHAQQDSRYVNGGYNDDYDGRGHYNNKFGRKHHDKGVQLGPRPFFLVKGMEDSRLKDRLMKCQNGPFYRTDFSISHRGAALQFPEHTKESYEAGARMGAGIVECDVTFTKDGALVCRHAECDLHTTTNIVATPLNNQCTVPWIGPPPAPAPRCCASDLTLAQFKSVKGKMDASNPNATTAEGFLGGTATWRTDLYTSRGTLLTHAESIQLIDRLGGKFTPELKFPDNPDRVVSIFGSQANYAQKLIDEYKNAGVHPKNVWPQSFNVDDILYWIQNEPQFGKQAVYLDDWSPPTFPPLTLDELKQLKQQGVKIIAPPIPALLAVDAAGKIVPSQYAMDIRSFGFDIITWTFERSDLRQGASKAGFYYAFDPTGIAVKTDSDMYKALDVLAREVKILGIFSDWPATVTYYANCMGLKWAASGRAHSGRSVSATPGRRPRPPRSLFPGHKTLRAGPAHRNTGGRLALRFLQRESDRGSRSKRPRMQPAAAFLEPPRTHAPPRNSTRPLLAATARSSSSQRPGGFVPTKYGRIISLSSCSTM